MTKEEIRKQVIENLEDLAILKKWDDTKKAEMRKALLEAFENCFAIGVYNSLLG